MKVFVIIAAVVAYTWAAPTVDLLHPSPVNPDVLVAVKPEEKIELITDPKEIGNLNRETNQPLYPTVSPKESEQHHITKSEHKASHQKRDIPVPLVAKHHHPEESSTEKLSSESPTFKDAVAKDSQNHQTVPLILNSTVPVTQENKREVINEKIILETQNKVPNQNYREPQRTIYGEEPTFNVEQQKHLQSAAISKEAKHFIQPLKRETSTSLVSKPEPNLSQSNNHEKQIYHEALTQKDSQCNIKH